MKLFDPLSSARRCADKIIARYHGKVTPEEIGQFIDVMQIDRCVNTLQKVGGETVPEEDRVRVDKLTEIRG